MPPAILAQTLIQVFPCRYAKAQVGPARGVNQSYPGAREQNIKTGGTDCSNVMVQLLTGRSEGRKEPGQAPISILTQAGPSSQVQTSLTQLQIAGPSRDQTGPVGRPIIKEPGKTCNDPGKIGHHPSKTCNLPGQARKAQIEAGQTRPSVSHRALPQVS